MKIIEKKLKETGEPIVWVKFTYDEELELANTVMSVLSKRWIPDDYRSIAKKIYNRKCNGKDILGEYLETLYDKMLYWNDFYQDYNDVELIPIPTIGETDDFLKPVPTLKGQLGGKKRIEWYTKEITRAWKEMWEVHSNAMSAISDDFVCFPGDEDSLKEFHDRQAVAFWEAVDASQSKYGISRDHAIREVADHMPRGSMDITDSNPHMITEGSLVFDDKDDSFVDDEDCFIIE